MTTLYVPNFFRQTANGLVSLNRIRTFMCLPETLNAYNTVDQMSPLYKSKSIVKVNNLSATYDTSNEHSTGICNEIFLMDEMVNNNNDSEIKSNFIQIEFN